MPTETKTDCEIVEAVKKGTLQMADLDKAVRQLLNLAFKAAENHRADMIFDYDGDHALAKEMAEQSAVLLKNDDKVLPLRKEQSVVFIGGFAAAPRYQGGGSSHIKSFKVVSTLKAAEAAGYTVTYAQGYSEEGTAPDMALIAEAVKAAQHADRAVIFAGLPDVAETEGIDRRHMNMPESHNALIQAVCAANSNTVVVLHGGSPMEMPWVALPKAVLLVYLGGQAVGEAVIDLLYG
jgi:beta-glucosidase